MGERRAGDGPMSREAEPSARDYLPPSLLLLSHSGGTYSLLFDSRPWVAVEVGTYTYAARDCSHGSNVVYTCVRVVIVVE